MTGWAALDGKEKDDGKGNGDNQRRACEEMRISASAEIERTDGKAMECRGVWQPIDDAPRDGRQILTWRAESMVTHVDGGAWYQTSFWSECFNALVGWPKETQPTHWMPLPKTPNVQGQGPAPADR